MEFRGREFSQTELGKLEFSFAGISMHEALELCGTATQRLDEPRMMDETEKSTLSGMLDGLGITPKPQQIEGMERLTLPGKIVSLGLFVINPIDEDVPMANPALEDLKKLTASQVYLTALGRSMDPDDAISLRDVPIYLQSEDGNRFSPELTVSGNYKFSVAPGKRYLVKYGPIEER